MIPSVHREPPAVARESGILRGRKWSIVGLLAAVVTSYLWFIATHCSPYAGPSDASGYLNAARLLEEGNLIQPIPRIEGLDTQIWDPHQQRPLGFHVDSEAATMTPSYPVGFPLHLWLASQVVGLDLATIPVNLMLVLAGAALMLAVGRRLGLSRSWALAAVGMLWACPLFLSYSLQPMSDMPATVWVLASIWCALKTRERWTWGFAAGASIAMSVLIRPTNLVVLLPVATVIGFRWRGWLAVVAGGIPGAAVLAWYNTTLYGSVSSTGYGSVGHLFRLEHVPHNAAHFALWIFLLLSPVVAVGALALLATKRRPPLLLPLVIAWVTGFVGVYVFYYHAGETWWYLRFILPAFPALILAACVALQGFTERLPRGMKLGCWVALTGVALAWELTLARRLRIDLARVGDEVYVQTAEWMKANAPANALVMQMQASGAFTYYTDFTIVRWDILTDEKSWPALQRAARAAGRPIYATLFEFEEERALQQSIPGNWERMERIDRVTIWRLVPD